MSNPIEGAVRAANRTFYDAFRRRDMEGMARSWATEHPVACLHPGWEAIHGRQHVLESFRAILGAAESPEVRPSDEVVVLLGPTAFVTCIEHLPGGELVATNVFSLEAGEWKIVHHHASPIVRRAARRSTPPSSLN